LWSLIGKEGSNGDMEKEGKGKRGRISGMYRGEKKRATKKKKRGDQQEKKKGGEEKRSGGEKKRFSRKRKDYSQQVPRAVAEESQKGKGRALSQKSRIGGSRAGGEEESRGERGQKNL